MMRSSVIFWLAATVLCGGRAGPAAELRQPSFRFALSPDALQGIRRLANGAWQLDLSVVPGRDYVIETSTNGVHWSVLASLKGNQTGLQWIDSDQRPWPLRLYRAVPRGFNRIQPMPDGTVDLILGVEPGPEYLIETSEDLQDWRPWERFMSRGPVVRFRHRPSPATPRLFYRARPTGAHTFRIQTDGTYLLEPEQIWGTAYVLEQSANLQDWTPFSAVIGTGSVQRVRVPPNSSTPGIFRLTATPVNDVYDAFIILGQSNAVGVGELADREPSDPSVWMFGNDYQFKVAYEPIDDCADQVDRISYDPITTNGVYGHSWALRAAKGVTAAQANRVIVIPCAKGSTVIRDWFPQGGRYDRGTLFGSANFRRSIAAAGGLKGIWYFGHETSSELPGRLTYTEDWKRLIGELRRDYGPVPVIYVQLGLNSLDYLMEGIHIVAEQQRLMETGYGDTNALPDHHMVVAFDLPLQDYTHLNRAAVNTLADRVALATREHIYGEAINGTGPRLISLTHPEGDKSKVKVRFNRSINQAFNNYDNQFQAYDNEQEVSIRHVQRDTDTTSVLLTLRDLANGLVSVSYGGRTAVNTNVSLPNVIKDSDGLPAPMFRKVPVR
jgi:hypothetical protein